MKNVLARWMLGALAVFALLPGAASAAEYKIYPYMSQSQISAVIAGLLPGDTLSVTPGAYNGIDLDLVNKAGAGLAGTSSAWITIRGIAASDGTLPLINANTSNWQEAVRLRSGCAYLNIQNLRLSAVGSTTQAGILFDANVHHINIRKNKIVNVTGIGIQIDSKNNVYEIAIEDNEIANTGTNVNDGYNGGQAFTAGGFWTTVATTGVYNIRLSRNLIHDTTGQEGDCAKFMYGVYASIMEDNVMYNCPRGVAQAENYGITSYGSGPARYTNAAYNNILRRNFLLNTAGVNAGEKNVAIWAGPGTSVFNNVIVNANIGIAARLESQVTTMRNLKVSNNTVYGVTDHAFSITKTETADASVVVTNNALIAVNAGAYGYRMPSAPGGMTAAANYYQGLDYAEAKPPVMNKITVSLTSLFIKPGVSVPGADFQLLPGSLLAAAGTMSGGYPSQDFDTNTRPTTGPISVGAYQWLSTTTNHWALNKTYKWK